MKNLVLLLSLVVSSVSLWAGTLDDFEDGQYRGWSDWTYGLGKIEETNKTLRLEIPIDRVRESMLVGAAWASESFAIEEGKTLEFRVDLVRTVGATVYPIIGAALAWVPDSEPLSAFRGYYLFKSASDVRIGKTLYSAFRLDERPALKNSNVTLVLALTGQGNNVRINAKVLDKTARDAVLYNQTVVDTPDADPLALGSDREAAPLAGPGRFALYAYYFSGWDEPSKPKTVQVFFDNAMVSTPAPDNRSPVIYAVNPAPMSSFVPTTTFVNFLARDDRDWDLSAGFGAILGAPLPGTTARISPDDSHVLTVSWAGSLRSNTVYDLTLIASDGQGRTNQMPLHFDTFNDQCRVIEVEDYDFFGGRFIDFPEILPEGSERTATSYAGQDGFELIDYRDVESGTSKVPYRSKDNVNLNRSLDYVRPKYVLAGGAEANVFDYEMGHIQAEEWLNYTRTFEEGEYEVYLREAVVYLGQYVNALERVTLNASGAETVTPLGRFIGRHNGFEFRNVPLTDVKGNKIKVRLAGVETLRLHQLAERPSDTDLIQNYLVFVPQVALHLQVISAPDVAGPYQADPTAAIQDRTVTIPRPVEQRRFYRVVSDGPVVLRNVRVEGERIQFEVE